SRVDEWWLPTPSGLQHVLELHERPTGDGPLVLRVPVSGDLRARRGGAGALLRHDPSGVTLSYAGLRAWDAHGTELTAMLDVVNGELELRVDDRAATYPLLIDPLLAVLEQKLEPSGIAADDLAGHTVAIDADTAVVGAPGEEAA